MTTVLHSARRRAAIGTAALLCLALLAPAVAQAQSYTWKPVVVGGGGFIPGIVFNTKTPNLVYARTDIGGAYRWDPSGARWIPLLDWLAPEDWNLTGVESLATDPVDPDRLYLAVGTYTNEWTSQNGAILRSTDRGATFQRTMLPFKLGGNMPARNMGERLAIDPNDNRVLYFAARSGNGLWRSADYGAAWAKVTTFPNPGTYVQDPANPYTADNVGVVWVTFDPRSGSAGNASRTIYVGVADKASSIYRSTDGGATWAAVPGQPTGFLPHHGVLSSTGFLYITYSNKGGPYDGESGDVWKLDTATGAWKLISPIPSTDTQNDYFGYGGLAVDAQHPDTIMVSALNSWWPDTNIFRSTDGGATWTRIWEFTSYPSRNLRYTLDITGYSWLTFGAIPVDPEPSPKLGWMVGDLEIDPFDSNRMMYGTGATLFAASDLLKWDAGGKITIRPMVAGLEETAVLDLASPPSGANLLSALGDLDGFRHTSLDAAPALMFRTPNLASSTSIDFAEASPNFLARVGNVDKALWPNINRAGFSYDGGGNWFQASTEPPGVTGGGTVAAAANASRVVWAPEGGPVSWSTNNGSSWTASTGIPSGARIAADRVNPNKFYGFASGAFYVSTNGGVSFAAAGAGLTGVTAAKVEAVFGREGDVWVAGEAGGLFHSTDSGATFTKVSSVTEAAAIGVGMAAPGQSYPALYLGGVVGSVRAIFRSDDGAATWVRLNDAAHQWGAISPVVSGDPRIYGRVYVGTNGRGIFYADTAGAVTPDFSVAASPAAVTVTRGASATSTIAVTRIGSFTGAVACTTSGLPSGVTASFNPTTITGSSGVLTFTAAATATIGSATVTIPCSSGSLIRSTTVTLNVQSADLPPTITLSPTTMTVNLGASATTTLTVTRPSGFTGALTCAASGLPSGVTASFNPASITGTSSVLTFTASTTATLGTSVVTVTCTAGTTTTSAALNLTVAPGMPSVRFSPSTLTVNPGAAGTTSLLLTRNGYTGSVSCTVSGLPAGATLAMNPSTATGTVSTIAVTVSVPATASSGTSSVTATCVIGSVSATAILGLTIGTVVPPDFSLAASPAALTVARGASGTSTIAITRTGGFTGTVALAASGLPAGVTASFNPASATGTSSVLTLTASSTATTGTANVTVTGTSGTLSRTATIALTVSPGSTGTVVTATPVVGANSPWYNELQLKLDNTAPLTAATITITVAVTPGVNPTGQYNTVGSPLPFTQTRTSTSTAVTYTWQLAAGQTLSAATGRLFAAQFGGNGTAHPTSGDLYSVTYTSGGVTSTVSGHF